ncbi:MAG: hybrid sensor histidine kinase/response regulator [Gammaproteobacteria bacterium]|nr:hybrid sensor histidine kinase/response regulator [Gammaproteobacteria bacterium]
MHADAEPLILVVDDNDAARYLKDRTLRKAGFRTALAAAGEEALRLAREERPDLVLLDIKLPDIDGFEVCRRLRTDEATASIAIVQISATFEGPEHRVRGLEGGADTFLVAPVEGTVLVATVRAMLRLRRAEAQLREFDRRKDEFLATLAHELRNPLAPVIYCLDSMQPRAAADPELAGCVSIMRRQIDHLVRLVDDLVDMSRITQNKLTLQLAPVTLQQILDSAIEAQRPQLEAKEQKLTRRLPEQPVELHADAVRLAQVFGNLLSNSIKYTPEGGRIEVSSEVSGDIVSVSVRDDGIGISQQDLDRVFELFVQVRQRGSGLGIGLALVTRIVEMHGGRVSASSDGPGRGSTFTVHLPVAPKHAAVETLVEGAQQGTPERKKVLVVDDNEDAVEALVLLLRAQNQDVRAAHGGLDAVEIAAEFQPDLIFMDVSMPDLDGLEAVTRIRQQPWSGKAVICVLSGHGQPADRQRSTAAGADLHWVKPVGREALIELIRRGTRPETGGR